MDLPGTLGRGSHEITLIAVAGRGTVDDDGDTDDEAVSIGAGLEKGKLAAPPAMHVSVIHRAATCGIDDCASRKPPARLNKSQR